MVRVTSSTGKAVTGINGTTVHYAFDLPFSKRRKQFCFPVQPSDEELHKKGLFI